MMIDHHLTICCHVLHSHFSVAIMGWMLWITRLFGKLMSFMKKECCPIYSQTPGTWQSSLCSLSRRSRTFRGCRLYVDVVQGSHCRSPGGQSRYVRSSKCSTNPVAAAQHWPTSFPPAPYRCALSGNKRRTARFFKPNHN
jgi:hypothetical protein